MKKKKITLIILAIIVILVLIFGIRCAVSANSFKTLVLDMTKNQNSIVKDKNGNTLDTIANVRGQNKVTSNQIPDNLKNAYVAIEDERYYKHGGIDVKRTVSAIGSYIFHRGSSSFGGSSIAQQLVKNLTGDNSNKVSRKVNEWWKACVIDSAMTKDEILTFYLNVIYEGPNVYGVGTGAKYYFNKSVENLTLEECAFLAGINNAPNSYNPFEDADNSERIKKRTKIVIGKMKELGYVSESEASDAIAKIDNGLNFQKGNIEVDKGVYSYHTDALLSQLEEDLSKRKNMSRSFAENYISMAGLEIYSTQDIKIQNQMETEFEKTKYRLNSKIGNDQSQAAMVIIDHSTGNVTGCVGALGKKTTARGFNRATQAVRQTGSSIKPIAVVVPGIAKRKFTASTLFNDEHKEFADGYAPEDYSDYLGDITVRRALESSQNVPFVEMLEEIKPKTAIKYLKKMGITTLTEEDNNLTLALGGLDKGISPLQMAGAYATIANDGVYIEPTFYTKVESSTKTVIKAKQKKRRVISKQTAYIIQELLTEPIKGNHGTARYCAIQGIDVAAKTGTTDENYDRWLCGFTPYYTAVVWYGFDQNEEIVYYGKKNPSGIIWSNVMSPIHANLPNKTFEKPWGITEVTICADSGKKGRTGCKDTYTEYYLWGTTPDDCDIHIGSSTNTNTTDRKRTVTNTFDETTLDDVDNPVVQENNTTRVYENIGVDITNTTTQNMTTQNTTVYNTITPDTTTRNTVQQNTTTPSSSQNRVVQNTTTQTTQQNTTTQTTTNTQNADTEN